MILDAVGMKNPLQYHEISVDTLVRVLRIRGVNTYFISLYLQVVE